MKTRYLLPIYLAVLTCGAMAEESQLEGKWAADNRTKGGLGTLLIFSETGDVTQIFGALVDFKYEVAGDTLNTSFTDPATGRVDTESWTLKIIGDKLIETPTNSTKAVEMIRVGKATPDAPQIVGVWTYKHYVGTMAFQQYTSHGLAQLSVPMRTATGHYTLQNNELELQFKDAPISKRTIRLAGDHLTLLEGEKEPARSFTRIAP